MVEFFLDILHSNDNDSEEFNFAMAALCNMCNGNRIVLMVLVEKFRSVILLNNALLLKSLMSSQKMTIQVTLTCISLIIKEW